MNIKRFVVISTFLAVAFASLTALAQKHPPGTAKNKQPDGAIAQPAPTLPMEHVDLSEPSRACSEASSFLTQPKLADAIAKARSDKHAAQEATRNPNAYLAKNGVNVPGNFQVQMHPSGGAGGGPSEAIKITVTVKCCPISIIIVIQF